MTTGRSKLSIDSAWLVALAVLLILTIWWIPGRGASGRSDSLSASRAGKKLFYDMVVGLHPTVGRDLLQVIPDPTVDTYLLLGPSRYPNRSEWEELHDWVAAGHTLVFAARWGDPAIDLSPFPIRIRPNRSFDFSELLVPDSSGVRIPVYPEIETEDLVWRSQGSVEFGDSLSGVEEYGAEVLVDQRGVQAAGLPIGDGYLIVCATDDPFTNQVVRDPNSARLAARLLESGVIMGPISFGEHLNRSGSPGSFGLLFDPDFRAFTLQLLICLVLFLWATARRFGPTEQAPQVERRATSEHARALGELYRRRRYNAHALALYTDYSRERAGSTTDSDTLTLLRQAGELVQSPSIDNRSAASMIRQLARHFDSEQGT